MNTTRIGVLSGAALAVACTAALFSTGALTAPQGIPHGPAHGAAAFGVAAIMHLDADGNVVGEQHVRNQLLDAGETFLLEQAFTGLGTDEADATQIGAICLSADDAPSSETMTATDFNAAHDADDDSSSVALNCKTDDAVTAAAGVATIGPLTFSSGTDPTNNWYAGDEVKVIGICKADSSDADVRNCVEPLFAHVDISDTTLGDGESLTVTYTFNMSSPSS